MTTDRPDTKGSMTEQRTITESDLASLRRNWLGVTTDAVLERLGFTVVPDPAPPLPTEPGTYQTTQGQIVILAEDGEWRTAYPWYAIAPPTDVVPFTRLETEVEGDERVLAILREYEERHPKLMLSPDGVAEVLREAREQKR